jgi:hypothetical protein
VEEDRSKDSKEVVEAAVQCAVQSVGDSERGQDS